MNFLDVALGFALGMIVFNSIGILIEFSRYKKEKESRKMALKMVNQGRKINGRRKVK